MAKALVLYVEDEEFDAMFMRRAFSKAGLDHDLHVVTDGQQAIDFLSGKSAETRKSPPDLVLLDLNLPVISGFEVLKWIRSQKNLQKLRVVIFSSSARVEDKASAQMLGADQYVQKPGSALDFLGVAERLDKEWLGASAPQIP